MTTLYRPVLIESAEQAAALDGKAILVFARTSTGEVLSSTLREDVIIRPTFPDYPGETVTALMPIEAEKIRPENRGGFFVTERHALSPFAAYYIHEEQA